MATNTRIKDALESQFYEYYKNNRSKYQRYSQDLPTLRLRLFHDMVEDGSFKSERKKKFDPFVERKCSVWLSEITGETKNFDDFRKAFRNILKRYKYKSEKYYKVCEEIVNENNFWLIQEDEPLSQNTKQEKDKPSLQNAQQEKRKTVLFNDTPNRHPINIDNDIVYRRMDNREIPFIRINGFSKMAPNNEVICEKCSNYMKVKFGEEFGFDDFCEYFDIELSSYKKWSNKWKLVCLKICDENRIIAQTKTNEIKGDDIVTTQDTSIFESVKSFLLYTFAYWVSFSLVGLILYNLRTIINYIFFLLSNIVVLLIEGIIEIISLLFTGNSANLNWDNSISAISDSIFPWFICMFILFIPWFWSYANDVSKKI